MQRKNQLINNLNISFLDNEKNGAALICLHGHFGTASNFAFIEKIFDGRVIIPDLRGHGLSEHAENYNIDEYLKDLEGLITFLNVKTPTIIGHSLGGIIAMVYEAKHQNSQMLIIEDIGTEVNGSNEFLNKFPGEFYSIYEVDKTFKDTLGRSLSTYFMESLYYDTISWKFRFNYDDMIKSQNAINGNYWNEWGKINCPVLIMKGAKSWATKKENVEEMINRNKMAELIHYQNAGHGIHDEEREKFCDDFTHFIKKNRR
jgi:esterase